MTTILIRRDDQRRYAEAERRVQRQLAAAARTNPRRVPLAERAQSLMRVLGIHGAEASSRKPTTPCCEPASCETS